MTLLTSALRGAQHRPGAVATAVPHTLLVLGGGGTLGSALLAEALADGGFARVLALVAEPLASGLRGFVPLPRSALAGAIGADSAVIVFERARHANGRDAAFVQPDVAELLPLAVQLRAGGVRRLVVVLPHAPALLPQALRHGLATLAEGEVAALGFHQLVFVRAAGHAPAAGAPGPMQRLARAWLRQLRHLVPQHEQPLRAVLLAHCVVQLLRLLPESAPATRVLAPEALYQALPRAAGGSSAVDIDAALRRWLQLPARTCSR